MGYTTTFSGVVRLSRPLTFAEAKTMLEFNEDPDRITTTTKKPSRSYMQWVPTKSLDGIVWDGQEKFYDYTEWLIWLCEWLAERSITADGELTWSGEDRSDYGEIVVSANIVRSIPKPLKRPNDSAEPITLDDLARMALERAAQV